MNVDSNDDDDLESILASMGEDTNYDEDDAPKDDATEAQEDLANQSAIDEALADADESYATQSTPANETDKKKRKTKNLAKIFYAILATVLLPFTFIRSLVNKRSLNFPWRVFFTFQITGILIVLMSAAAALSALYYLAPPQLKAQNISLSSEIVKITGAPQPVRAWDREHSQTQQSPDAHKTKNDLEEGSVQLQTIKAAHGREAPFNFYSVKPEIDKAISLNEKAKIAIIVNDLGLNHKRLENVLANAPSMTTLSFTPYAPLALDKNNTDNKQFEVWLSLPTEKANEAHDPGILGFYNSRDISLNQNALTNILNKQTAFTGFLIPPYSSFPEEENQYAKIIERMFTMGYGVVDASFAAVDPNVLMLGGDDFPYLQVDVYIDQILSADSITANFRKLEVIAAQDRQAIGLIRGYPLSIDIYKKWSETLDEKGFVLLPLSSFFKTEDEKSTAHQSSHPTTPSSH